MRTVHLHSLLKHHLHQYLLKKAAKIDKASAVPNRDKVATVSKAQVQEIAELKMADLKRSFSRSSYGV